MPKASDKPPVTAPSPLGSRSLVRMLGMRRTLFVVPLDLLPGADPTVMGWKERTCYLGEHAPELFDRNGNAGPTVWANGRVVGGWTQHDDGELVVGLLEPVDAR